MKILVDISNIRSKLSFIVSKFLMMSLVATISVSGIMAQSKAYRATDRQVMTVLTRIENKTDSFKNQMDNALDRSSFNNTNTEDMINNYISDFENSTDSLRRNFNNRVSVNSDVQIVLQKAASIDSFLRTNRLNTTVQNQWRNLKTDLNTLSRYYNVSWNWNNVPINNNNNLAYTVAYSTVQNALSSLETNADRYKNDLDTALDRSWLNNTRSEDSINRYVGDFESATNSLKNKFQNGTSTDTDVENVLSKGYAIDAFMRDYQLDSKVINQWSLVRRDLNNLATYYAVAMNWNQTTPWNNQYDTNIDGTYRLNTSLSDDVNSVVNSIGTAYYSGQQRDRVSRNLQKRLASPEYIALDKNGNSVTIAANGMPQATFQADGIARTEKQGNRQIKVTGKTNYDSISLSYEGDKINDYYVSFMPVGNSQLRIIRRVYLENRNETITVASVYDKIRNNADFGWVAGQGTPQNNVGNNVFYIPNGRQIQGTLNESLSTKTVNNGDRFSINVTSPSVYAGATLYGYVSEVNRSGRVSGRANMTLNFEQIRLSNGQTYNFRGIVEQVFDAKGNKIDVNNEGAVRDGNQTTKTVVRSGIGAGIGAIIGAIISGGDGAAIGAAIGGSAGAGSVIAQGRDDLTLEQGSQIVISSTAPASVANR